MEELAEMEAVGHPVQNGAETPEAPKPPIHVLTDQERELLNVASSLKDLARINFAKVWIPIRDKHNLPDGDINYDRETGEVRSNV